MIGIVESENSEEMGNLRTRSLPRAELLGVFTRMDAEARRLLQSIPGFPQKSACRTVVGRVIRWRRSIDTAIRIEWKRCYVNPPRGPIGLQRQVRMRRDRAFVISGFSGPSRLDPVLGIGTASSEAQKTIRPDGGISLDLTSQKMYVLAFPERGECTALPRRGARYGSWVVDV